MIKRASLSAGVLIAALLSIRAQDIKLSISGGSIPVLAVPELRASGDAQRYMTTLNQTLWEDLAGSGMFKMAAKTMYPTAIPQQPQDFRQNQIATGTAQGSRRADWSGPPVFADYVAFGYSAVQNGVFVLYGWDVQDGGPDDVSHRYTPAATGLSTESNRCGNGARYPDGIHLILSK